MESLILPLLTVDTNDEIYIKQYRASRLYFQILSHIVIKEEGRDAK